MAAAYTHISDLINPQVMASIISAKITNKIKITPYAKVDTTLQGRPGDTITVPQFGYIGDAAVIAEGVAVESVKLTATSTTVTVKKAMKAVNLSDEAVLSGYGNPVGEASSQLGSSIAGKIDSDAMDALLHAQKFYDDATNKIKYENIVEAIGVFAEEDNSEKVMFVHPNQVTTLRKDSNFISADKYDYKVVATGEIGMIANAHIVPTNRVQKFDTFYKFDTAGTATTAANIATVQASLPNAVVGDKVTAVSTASYFNPVVQLTTEADEAYPLTLYLKRDTNVETERNTLSRTTDISADKFYAVALSNTSKVVLARIKA